MLRLPPDAVRLATSPTAENDMWGATAGRVLAIQGHPEMACATALDKILPAVSRWRRRLHAVAAHDAGSDMCLSEPLFVSEAPAVEACTSHRCDRPVLFSTGVTVLLWPLRRSDTTAQPSCRCVHHMQPDDRRGGGGVAGCPGARRRR